MPHPHCYFSPTRMLRGGDLGYVETGNDPVYRWRRIGQDARCFDKNRLQGGWDVYNRTIETKPFLEPQGGCIVAEPVAATESDAVLRVERVEIPKPHESYRAVRI